MEENVYSVEYILENGLDKKYYGFVYFTKNKIDTMKYIGQRKFYHGWKGYKGSGDYLKDAIKLHGKNNFIRDIIAFANSEEELNKLEEYYIQKYDAVKSKDYYNLAPGGNCGSYGTVSIVQLTLDGEFIREWDSITNAETELNIYNISDVCRGKGKKSSGGFLWAYKNDYDNGIIKVYENLCGSNRKSIIQLDLQGNFIKQWNSARDIEKELGFGYKNISLCCSGKTNRAYNFMWRFLDEYDKTQIKKYVDGTFKPIVQLDLKGNYIKNFESAISASQELGVSPSAITGCCRNERGKVYNFMFMYKVDWDKGIKKDPYISQEKPIVQLDLDGNFIKEWKNGQIAAKEVGVQNPNLVKCLKGKRNMCGGFKWEYADKYYNARNTSLLYSSVLPNASIC